MPKKKKNKKKRSPVSPLSLSPGIDNETLYADVRRGKSSPAQSDGPYVSRREIGNVCEYQWMLSFFCYNTPPSRRDDPPLAASDNSHPLSLLSPLIIRGPAPQVGRTILALCLPALQLSRHRNRESEQHLLCVSDLLIFPIPGSLCCMSETYSSHSLLQRLCNVRMVSIRLLWAGLLTYQIWVTKLQVHSS